MSTPTPTVVDITARARLGARVLATAPTTVKNQALCHMADLLDGNCRALLQANADDMRAAREQGIAGALLERLKIDESKVRGRIASLHTIAGLPDPVGQYIEQKRLPNGIVAGRVRVPLGVILMIYEARPHVTVNAGAFALKSGNAIICKGGSEARACNGLLGSLWAEALRRAGLPEEAVQVACLGHGEVDELLTMTEAIDLVIPRGGKNLITTVAERSRIPVIKHFEGICHVYVGAQADPDTALQIVMDSKLLMPAVCNAAETVLVDASMRDWVPELVRALQRAGVTVRGCPVVCAAAPGAEPACDEDWHTEYLDTIYSIRVVDGLEAAIEHITRCGSGHTDVIVTENYSHARRFTEEVDSSVVLVNASTMFCDGETLGMGAEIGISTDKFHARGPMGLTELTSYKHVLWGTGQIMGPPRTDTAPKP